MIKQISYKVVENVDGRLLSLYHRDLEEYTIEYSTKTCTPSGVVCFTADIGLALAIGPASNLKRTLEIWKCEGYITDPDANMAFRSDIVDLIVEPDTIFMTDVRLLERIL